MGPRCRRLRMISETKLRNNVFAACIWRVSRSCMTAQPSRFVVRQTCPSTTVPVTRPPAAERLARARPPSQRTPRTQCTRDPSSSVTSSRGSSPTAGWYWASVPSRVSNRLTYHRSTLTLVGWLPDWSTITTTARICLTILPPIYRHSGSCIHSPVTSVQCLLVHGNHCHRQCRLQQPMTWPSCVSPSTSSLPWPSTCFQGHFASLLFTLLGAFSMTDTGLTYLQIKMTAQAGAHVRCTF